MPVKEPLRTDDDDAGNSVPALSPSPPYRVLFPLPPSPIKRSLTYSSAAPYHPYSTAPCPVPLLFPIILPLLLVLLLLLLSILINRILAEW